MKRALCVWLPNWPIQRLRQARPDLKRRTIVLHQQRRGSAKVIACSQSAHDAGVFPGMPLAEAIALPIERIYLQEYEPTADRLALEQLARECEIFSPLVGLEEHAAPESLLLDVTGLEPLFGSEQLLAEQMLRTLKKQGIAARVAIAATYGAAWAMAQYAEQTPVIVREDQTQEALSNLPMAALRISIDTARALANVGLLRIGQLLALPRPALASRFEPELLQRLDQALGLRDEALVVHRTLPEIVEECKFEHPRQRRDELELVMAQLVERISQTLRSRQQGALQLECELSVQDQSPVYVRVGMYQATAAADHLRQLLLSRFEQMALPGLVTGVRLAVPLAAPWRLQQQQLFVDPSQHDGRRQVALLVDRLSSRLSRNSVMQARLLADAQPEFAYRYEPLTGNLPSALLKRSSRSRALPALRPLLLEPAAQAIEVMWKPPQGVMPHFYFQDQRLTIEHAAGPERIYTGWWRGRAVHRDYYCVQASTGQRFWLFRQLRSDQWYLHGIFD